MRNSLLVLVVSVGLSFSSLSIAETKKWFEGGTLHKATTVEWKAATYRNKTATSADFALGFPKIKEVVTESGSIDVNKIFAVDLATCIDTAISEEKEGIHEDTTLIQIAVVCGKALGWVE